MNEEKNLNEGKDPNKENNTSEEKALSDEELDKVAGGNIFRLFFQKQNDEFF